jgi:hypothetical protein
MTPINHLTINAIPLTAMVRRQVGWMARVGRARLNLRGQMLLAQHHYSPVMMTLLLSDCATTSSPGPTSQQSSGSVIAHSVR